jgi:glycosyltransferase involved in cell wall biosynthesis
MMPDEAKMTFVVTCKGRLEHLRRSLPRMAAQKGCKVIVVDSSCPDGAGHWVSSKYPEVTVVFLEDNGTFNPSRSRNAALKICETEWICFVDADVILSREFFPVVKDIIKDKHFYTFKRVPGMRGSGGTCIVKRADAHHIGGYDDLIVAWSGEDVDFYYRLVLYGIHRIKLAHDFIDEVIQHSDDSRTRYHSNKDIRINGAIAMFYVAAKLNIMKHMSQINENAEFRKMLFDKAADSVMQAARSYDHRASIEVSFPSIMQKPPLKIKISNSIKLTIDLS